MRVVRALEQVRVERREELEEVFRQYRGVLTRRAQLSLGDASAAEDAVQDAFLNLLEHFEEARHDVLHALFGYVGDRLYQRRRRGGLRHRQWPGLDAADLVGQGDPAQEVELHALLEDLWSSLTPRQRPAMAAWVAGYTLRETAELRRMPPDTVAAQIRRARERARRRRGDAWAGLGLVVAGRRWFSRLRSRAWEAVGLAGEPVHNLVLSWALSVLAVSTAATPCAAVAGTASLPAHALTGAALPPPNTPLVAPSEPGSAIGQLAPTPTVTPSPGILPLPGPSTAAQETPEDTQLVAATPSPDFTRDHTILALGVGASCSCPTLLRSTDGGATWQAAPGAPPSGKALVLPPDYPHDPRIFIANDPFGGIPDFVAGGFGQPFWPLPLPPGPLAFSAGFDRSDPRIFVATADAVLTYNLATKAVQPVLAYPNSAQVATLATPVGDDVDAALVLAPRNTLVPTAAAPLTAAVALFACGQASSCRMSAATSLPSPGQLVVSPAYPTDHTLVVADRSMLLVSTDAGASLHTVSLPSDATLVDVALAGPELWLATLHSSLRLLHASLAASPAWTTATADPTSPTALLVAAAPDRILDLVPGRGFRCTTDGGRTWSPRCSPL